MSALVASKKALRSQVSSVLRSISEAEVTSQSQKITSLILQSPTFQRSKCVSCYMSMDAEISTRNLVREILLAGKTLYIPKIVKGTKRKMNLLKIYDLEDLDATPSGVWGIREPDDNYGGSPRANAIKPEADPIDLILVPGVAFDHTLSRLGHGKGYYDTFLSTYAACAKERGNQSPHLIALALTQQVLTPTELVPVDDTDWKMDAIATADGFIERTKEL